MRNKLRHGGQYFKDYHSQDLSVDMYIYIIYFYKSKAKNAIILKFFIYLIYGTRLTHNKRACGVTNSTGLMFKHQLFSLNKEYINEKQTTIILFTLN